MTSNSNDHVAIPKILLWGMTISIIGGLGGGGFWLGTLSQRVFTLEQGHTAIEAIGARLDTFNARLSAIETSIRFVIHKDFPGQEGLIIDPHYDLKASR